MAGDVPTGVKVISVLFYIVAVLSVIGGIAMLFGAGLVGQLPLGIIGAAGAGLFVAMGIVSIALAVLYFFIGHGLWNAKNWARIVALILAVLGIIAGIMALFSVVAMGIVELVISGLILWYLGFNKDVKRAFR